MFPEYRELITQLKHKDMHFTNLFEEHNRLDHLIKNMEDRIVPGSDVEIETLKKQKLHIKDQIYVVLRRAAAEQEEKK